MTQIENAREGREIMALVSGRGELDRTVADLRAHKFARQDISIVATKETVSRVPAVEDVQVSAPGRRAADTRLADISHQRLAENQSLLVALITFFCAGAGAAMAASSGALWPIIGAAAIGGGIGAGCGGGLAVAVRTRHLKLLQEKLQSGEALVGVRVDDTRRETEAAGVLEAHTRETLHVHKLRPEESVSSGLGVNGNPAAGAATGATREARFEDLKADPSGHFADPMDVVRHEALTLEQKLEILESWEHDAIELQAAEAENMAGGEPARLTEVRRAIDHLTQ